MLLAKHLAPGSGNFAKGESKTPAHPAPAPARTQRNLPCHIFFTYFVCKGEKKEKIKEKKAKRKETGKQQTEAVPHQNKKNLFPPAKTASPLPRASAAFLGNGAGGGGWGGGGGGPAGN